MHCLCILSYISILIALSNGQYDQLNLMKKIKTHELEYGTVLTSLEGPAARAGKTSIRFSQGAREQLALKVKMPPPPETMAGEDLPAVTRCTTDMPVKLHASDMPVSVEDEKPEEKDENDEDDDKNEDDDKDHDDEKDADDGQDEDTNDIENNEVDSDKNNNEPVKDEKVKQSYNYKPPARTHVPDHYLDDV